MLVVENALVTSVIVVVRPAIWKSFRFGVIVQLLVLVKQVCRSPKNTVKRVWESEISD
jgi:hypothetical protein